MSEKSLLQHHCVPCEGGVDPLSAEEAQKYHAQTPQWQLHEKSIEREFRLKNFKEVVKFFNEVAEIAEEEGHHPDTYVYYNKIHFKLTTHAIGGLSVNDFVLAAKIDALAPNQPL